MPRDLGTYHVKVYFTNGKSYIDKYNTGGRYTSGSGHTHPIDAHKIPPTWDSEEDLIDSIIFNLTENGCDCNKILNWHRSQQLEDPEDHPCGDEWEVEKLILVCPDGQEKLVYSIP